MLRYTLPTSSVKPSAKVYEHIGNDSVCNATREAAETVDIDQITTLVVFLPEVAKGSLQNHQKVRLVELVLPVIGEYTGEQATGEIRSFSILSLERF